LQNTSEAVKEACEVYKRHAADMQGLLTELADELESLQYQKTTMTTATKRTNSKVRYAREKVLLCMGVSAF
jgi:prefoldin subunit 5